MKKKVSIGAVIVVVVLSVLAFQYFVTTYDERSHYITGEIKRLEKILKDQPGEIDELFKKAINRDEMKALNEFTNGFNRKGRLNREYVFEDKEYFQVYSNYLYDMLHTDLIPMFYVDEEYHIYYFDGERK